MPCCAFSMSPPAACSSLRMMFSTSSPDVAGLGQRRRVDDRERHREQAGQRLREQRLARAGRPDEQDVRLRQLDFVPAARLLLDFQPLVVVVDGDRELLLRLLLADDVLVQELLDLDRHRQRGARAAIELVVVGDDVVADLDAFVADEYRRARNELADVVLILVAERAAQDFVLAGLLRRHCFPGDAVPADPSSRSLLGPLDPHSCSRDLAFARSADTGTDRPAYRPPPIDQ